MNICFFSEEELDEYELDRKLVLCDDIELVAVVEEESGDDDPTGMDRMTACVGPLSVRREKKIRMTWKNSRQQPIPSLEGRTRRSLKSVVEKDISEIIWLSSSTTYMDKDDMTPPNNWNKLRNSRCDLNVGSSRKPYSDEKDKRSEQHDSSTQKKQSNTHTQSNDRQDPPSPHGRLKGVQIYLRQHSIG